MRIICKPFGAWATWRVTRGEGKRVCRENVRHAEHSAAESKHLYRFVAGVRSYYAKEMLRLRCAVLSMTE
jgi:hypothetical protein